MNLSFLATLVHDLKAPMLAANQTISYLLKEAYGPITDEQREVLGLIQSTNASSLDMITTLLDVHRYEAGKMVLAEEDFDLVELVKESVKQLKVLGDNKNISIKVNVPKEKIFVTADDREVKRVIHNLVSNAINHGIHNSFINCNIELINDTIMYKSDDYNTLENPLEISKSVLVSIEDNGVGIKREQMPLLFKIFTSGKDRKSAGSGLGLYYSHQVITAHKGHIWAESSDNGGSTFKFTLPL